MVISLGWFSTGRGPGSRGLFEFVQERILRGEIPAQIEFVFSNRGPGEAEGSDLFFDLVHRYRIPLITLSSRRFRQEVGGDFASRRLEYDRRVVALLQDFNPHIFILAGYMLIVGREMCRRYTMLNLHPALPTGPAGTWQEVIWSLIESRPLQTGAMVHIALEEVDRGPIVTYFTIPLTGKGFDEHWRQIEKQPVDQLQERYGEALPLFQRIRQEEYRREPYLLAETIKAIAQEKVVIRAFEVFNDRGEPLPGLCLNDRIESLLRVA